MDCECQCGTVTFKTPLPRPLALYICHCTSCQRQSASAFGCSAIFPIFSIPYDGSESSLLACYSRPTASGHTLNCFFCKSCGTRMVHMTPGKSVLSIKGGCITGLTPEDWANARHIWTRNAMVPIPEGVERCPGEPEDDDEALLDG